MRISFQNMIDYFLSYDRQLLISYKKVQEQQQEEESESEDEEIEKFLGMFVNRIRTKVFKKIDRCVASKMKKFFDMKYESIKMLEKICWSSEESSSNDDDNKKKRNKKKKNKNNNNNKKKRFFAEIFESDFKRMILEEIMMDKNNVLRGYVKKIKIPRFMRGIFYEEGEKFKKESGIDIVFVPFPSDPPKGRIRSKQSSSSAVSFSPNVPSDSFGHKEKKKKKEEVEMISEEQGRRIKKRRKAQGGGTCHYFGMVDREGQFDGYGVVIREKRSFLSYSYSKVFEGYWKKGLEDGVGKVFDHSSKTELFHGVYKNGLRNGKGAEYQPGVKHSIFTGIFQNGSRHGLGEEYIPSEGKMRKGKWDSGTLLFEHEVYNLKMISYETVRPYLDKAVELGKGGNGIVYKVPSSAFVKFGLKTTGVPFYAVKMIEGSWGGSVQFETDVIMIKKQAQLCSSVRSPNVIEVFGIIEGEHLRDRKIGVVMELGKMSVDDLIRIERGTIAMSEKIRVMKETAEGMYALHDRKIMHRDLKWANVLLDFSRRVKITDFDAIREDENSFKFSMNSNTYTKTIGTMYFLDPTATTGHYTLAVDVYSFGLMMYSLIFELILPFDTPDHRCEACGLYFRNMTPITFQRCVRIHDFRPDVSDEWMLENKKKKNDYFMIEKEMVDLMEQCWHPNPNERPIFEEIVEWFKKFQYDKYRSKFVSMRVHFPPKEKIRAKNSKVLVTEPKIEHFVGKLEKRFKRRVTDLKATLIHERKRRNDEHGKEEEYIIEIEKEELHLILFREEKEEKEEEEEGEEGINNWRNSLFLQQVIQSQDQPKILVTLGERILERKQPRKKTQQQQQDEEGDEEDEGEVKEENNGNDHSTVISKEDEFRIFYDEIEMKENLERTRTMLSETKNQLKVEKEKNHELREQLESMEAEKMEMRRTMEKLMEKIERLEENQAKD